MFAMNSPVANYMVEGSDTGWYDGRPIFENQVGVYQDGKAWVVGHRRERGQLFELGRYVDKETAIKCASGYVDVLKGMGVM